MNFSNIFKLFFFFYTLQTLQPLEEISLFIYRQKDTECTSINLLTCLTFSMQMESYV